MNETQKTEDSYQHITATTTTTIPVQETRNAKQNEIQKYNQLRVSSYFDITTG